MAGKVQVFEIRENGKVLEQHTAKSKAEASKRRLKAKGRDVKVYSVFQTVGVKPKPKAQVPKSKPKAVPKTKPTKQKVAKPNIVRHRRVRSGNSWPRIESSDFKEGWYLLDCGTLFYAQVSIENGPEADRRYMTKEEYDRFYSEGWCGYIDYITVDPTLSGDGGLIPYKPDWTIMDVVRSAVGCEVSGYVDMDDPDGLRNAVDDGDDVYVRELIDGCPELSGFFRVISNNRSCHIGQESVFTNPIDDIDPEGWFKLADGWVLYCFRSDMNDVFEEYDDDDEEWIELEEQGWVRGGMDCFLVGPNGQIDDPFYAYKIDWSLDDFVRHNFDTHILEYIVVDDPHGLRERIEYEPDRKAVIEIMWEYPDLFGHLL